MKKTAPKKEERMTVRVEETPAESVVEPVQEQSPVAVVESSVVPPATPVIEPVSVTVPTSVVVEPQPFMEDVQPSNAPVSEGVNTKTDGVSKKKLILFFIFGILFGGLFFGGLIYYKLGMEKVNLKSTDKAAVTSEPSSVSTPAPSPTTVPTAEPQVKLSTYKLTVLNGTTTSGKASVTKELLVKAGFTQVLTGNADNNKYTDTEVSLKAGVPLSVFTSIEKALSGSLKVVQVDALPEKTGYDILIIVGSLKK